MPSSLTLPLLLATFRSIRSSPRNEILTIQQTDKAQRITPPTPHRPAANKFCPGRTLLQRRTGIVSFPPSSFDLGLYNLDEERIQLDFWIGGTIMNIMGIHSLCIIPR